VADAVSDHVGKRLMNVIELGVRKGLTSEEMATSIQQAVGGTYSAYRAEALARLEINRMLNWIDLEAMRLSGVIAGKTWLSMQDAFVRDSHDAADGQTVPVNQPFVVGGMRMMYPGDPAGGPKETVNCRCSMLASISRDYLPSGEDYETIMESVVGTLSGE
jgi:SPP1 gp7 family putative phage head morphogenesis protein